MSNQEIIDKLLSGEMKLYQVDKEVSAKEATDIRREFLEQKYDLELSNIANYTLDMERASARNIENSIGRSQHLKAHWLHQSTEEHQQLLLQAVLMREWCQIS